jgi:hypothetical protein
MLKFITMKIILLVIILLVGGIFVTKFLIFPQKQISEQSLEKIAPADLKNVAKVHIHEIYEEYEKNPEGTTKKWIGQKVIAIGIFWQTRGEDELLIYPFPYVIRPIQVFASCPVKDKKLINKVRYGDRFVAITGKVNKIGIFEGMTRAPAPTEFYKFFELGLKDCELLNRKEVSELRANFSKETWTLEIENYGYSLEVWLRKIEEAPGELNRWKIFSMNPFERKAKLDAKESILGGFKRPGEYVLEIIDGESTIENLKVLKSWKLKLP